MYNDLVHLVWIFLNYIRASGLHNHCRYDLNVFCTMRPFPLLVVFLAYTKILNTFLWYKFYILHPRSRVSPQSRHKFMPSVGRQIHLQFFPNRKGTLQNHGHASLCPISRVYVSCARHPYPYLLMSCDFSY